MSDKRRFFVSFSLNPTRLHSRGMTWQDNIEESALAGMGNREGVQVREITEAQWDEFSETSEPSSLVAKWFGLPYSKRLPVTESSPVNLVELVADDEDGGFDQPCRFGNRVEQHAVYCHNNWWVDAPRKCRRTWYTGGETRDEDCPGFEPRKTSVGPDGNGP